MTIGICIHIPGKGAVLAHDSRATTEDGAILSDDFNKHLCQGSLSLIVAGYPAILDIFKAKKIKSYPKLREFVFSKSWEYEYTLAAYDSVLDQIFWLESNGTELKPKDHVVIGTGSAYSLGVLHVMPSDTIEEAKEAAKWAVSAAIKHNTYCGGGTVILTRSRR